MRQSTTSGKRCGGTLALPASGWDRGGSIPQLAEDSGSASPGLSTIPAEGGTATAIGNRPTPVRRGVSPRALTRMGPPRRMSPAAISVWVALAFGTLSLALRFTPGYDPWTWALWGREIAHLDLSTVAGPAWKPLPVVLLALASPLGLGAPAVWLVVARAGWVLAVLTVWRLTYRTVRCMAGPFTAVTAAGIAGIGLVLSVGFTGFLLPLAMSEPLLTAAVLLAVDYHARGRHGAGFVSLTVAALLRPEVWPILLASGVVVVRMTPRHRLRRSLLVSGVGVAVLALWYVPDWLGSGDLMRSVERAAIPTQGGPLLTQNPALAVLRSAGQMLPLPWMLAAGVTVFAAVCCLFRYVPRKATSTRIVFLVTAVGLLWLGTQMLMTAAHRSSGEPRYLVVTTACAAVLAGVGVVLTPRLLAMAIGRVRRRPLSSSRWASTVHLAVLAASAGVMVSWGYVTAVPFGQKLKSDVHDATLHTDVDLDVLRGLSRAGGADAVRRCGIPITGPYQVPEIAFQLGLHLDELGYDPARAGLVVAVPGWVESRRWPQTLGAEPIRAGTVTIWPTRPC